MRIQNVRDPTCPNKHQYMRKMQLSASELSGWIYDDQPIRLRTLGLCVSLKYAPNHPPHARQTYSLLAYEIYLREDDNSTQSRMQSTYTYAIHNSIPYI